MLPSLLFLLPLFAAPEIRIPPGPPIVLDGRIDAKEWAEAFSASRDVAGGGSVRLMLMRTGPWLAIAVDCDRPYRGEILRCYVTDAYASWCSALTFGIGQPALPPLLHRRAPPDVIAKQALVPESPRACLARVDVTGASGWRAEYLVRLTALGIGRGDRRVFQGLFAVGMPGEAESAMLRLPDHSGTMLDLASYARLVSDDAWGAGETWAPATPEQSREFDDGELLWALYLEHDRISLREPVERLVIANAVRPRSLLKITALRDEIAAARDRNPTLPCWSYFLGRLLHEANLFAEAKAILDGVPPSLRALDPFVNLLEEHLIDTEQWQKALDVCAANPHVRGHAETVRTALNGRRAAAEEAAARADDAAKEARNPTVRISTTKGDVTCELFEDDAPSAVTNFMDLLLRHRYYDGLAFSEVLGGLMARTGDPRTRRDSNVTLDGPEWRLKPDAKKRGLLRGTLATVPVEGNAFHGSQFLITVAPLLRDADKVIVFGRVTEGQEVVDSIEEGDRVNSITVLTRRNHAYDALMHRLR